MDLHQYMCKYHETEIYPTVMLSGNRELSVWILCLLCHILLVVIWTEYSR